jgi:hypothetical protein
VAIRASAARTAASMAATPRKPDESEDEDPEVVEATELD